MGILSWLVVGAIAGWAAGKLVRGGGFGLIGDIIVGVLGALVGGWLAGTLFKDPNAISGFNLTTIIVAILGAVVLLFVIRLVRR